MSAAEKVSVFTEILENQGALSLSYSDAADDPILEPPLGQSSYWPQTQITALFEADADLSNLTQYLENKNLVYRIEFLQDQCWERQWMDDFKPMKFGERTWIIPSHHRVVDKNAINIQLDPGLAFGTGTHPTTALCLQWIDGETWQNKILIDYGCGSGVLAIAALKHGAKKAYAIDYDEQALLATQHNAKCNDLSDTQLITALPNAAPLLASDVILANILAEPLLTLRDTFYDLLRPGGSLVLSGILEEQINALTTAYQTLFSLESICQQGEWALLFFKKSL